MWKQSNVLRELYCLKNMSKSSLLLLQAVWPSIEEPPSVGLCWILLPSQLSLPPVASAQAGNQSSLTKRGRAANIDTNVAGTYIFTGAYMLMHICVCQPSARICTSLKSIRPGMQSQMLFMLTMSMTPTQFHSKYEAFTLKISYSSMVFRNLKSI